MIEAAIYENARPSSDLSLPAEMAESPFAGNGTEAQSLTAPLPSSEKGATFIEAYLAYVHTSFPFISKKTLWDTHRSRKDVEDATTDEARHHNIILWLVYAIGSRCLQLIGTSDAASIEPEGYYCSAVTKIQDQLNVPSIHNIEITLLVAIYALRSPSSMLLSVLLQCSMLQ